MVIGVTEQRIRIVTEFFEKGREKMEKANRRIVETSELQKRGIKKVISVQEKINGKWAEQDRRVKKGIPVIRRFQAQYLSLLFTGMALYRTFGGLIQAQMELWGLNEGFSAMLMVVMIPTMEMLSDILWPIIEWFMNLPEPVKKLIGIFIIAGAIIGWLAMTFGMLMVALTSPGIASAISLFGSFALVIAGIGFILWGVIDIVTNWGKSVVGVMKGVGKVIIGVGLILFLFIGWWALIPIAVGAAVWAIAKYWHKLPGYIQKPLIFIYVLLEAFGKFLYATIINPWIAFVKILYYVLTGQWKKAWDTAKDAVISVVDPFIKIGKRYEELVTKSDKYTAEQNKDMSEVANKTTNTASLIQNAMGNSLKITQENFEATTIEAELSAVKISDSWESSSANMANYTTNAVNSINDSLSKIPTRIETIHETIERTVSAPTGEKGGITYPGAPTKITIPKETADFWSKKGYGPNTAQAIANWVKLNQKTPTTDYIKKMFPFYWLQGGGWIPKTGPYILHEGEYVNTIGKAKGMTTETIINLNPVYNVNVSDKREFEMMIRNNNFKLVEDLRRLVEI